MSNNKDYKGNIFTPKEVADAGYKAALRAMEYKDVGVPLNIAGGALGEYFAPLLPWEICAVQAQTHAGQPGILAIILQAIAVEILPHIIADRDRPGRGREHTRPGQKQQEQRCQPEARRLEGPEKRIGRHRGR